MQKIHEIHNEKVYKERILQFGEGNFLRAFVDWMVDKMNKTADFNTSVVVVQPIQKGLVEVLNEQKGLYTLYLNGIKDKKAVREHTIIESISRGIDPYKCYDAYMKMATSEELRFIISNTTEAGIAFDEKDQLKDRPQNSFPGKLTALLYERYKFFHGDLQKGLIMIPCELIDRNGEKLKEMILKYANLWSLEEGFIDWIHQSNSFCNTLVDRIVPGYPKEKIDEIRQELGYEDQLVVEGESFHLWVIEGPDELKEELPTAKADLNVLFTKDITPYRTRKVRILNGAHTSMVPVSLLYGLETVRETLEDDRMGEFVQQAVFDEIVPTLDLPKEELEYFADAVLDRFKNPFVKHYLTNIALNSHAKYETRVLPSVLEYQQKFDKLPKRLVFALSALIRLYKGEVEGKIIPLKDTDKVMKLYKDLWDQYDGTQQGLKHIVKTVLAQQDIWKMDLNEIKGLTDGVTNGLCEIEKLGMKKALQQVMSSK